MFKLLDVANGSARVWRSYVQLSLGFFGGILAVIKTF